MMAAHIRASGFAPHISLPCCRPTWRHADTTSRRAPMLILPAIATSTRFGDAVPRIGENLFSNIPGEAMRPSDFLEKLGYSGFCSGFRGGQSWTPIHTPHC
jgi:hypothetical protein